MNTDWHPAPSTVELQPNVAHVWRIQLDDPEPDVAHYRALLDAEESARANRFRFDRDRNRFIVGRGVLRTLVSRYAGMSAQDVRFVFSPQGKPGLDRNAEAGQVEFNVSHSGSLILIGFTADYAIGVDVERIERRVAEDQIAERFFSPDEVARLRALPEQDRHAAFFDCWSRKEAFIKAHGHGMSLALDSFSVAFGPGETARLIRFDLEPGPEPWSLAAPDVGEGYAGAVCVAAAGASFRYFEFAA